MFVAIHALLQSTPSNQSQAAQDNAHLSPKFSVAFALAIACNVQMPTNLVQPKLQQSLVKFRNTSGWRRSGDQDEVRILKVMERASEEDSKINLSQLDGQAQELLRAAGGGHYPEPVVKLVGSP